LETASDEASDAQLDPTLVRLVYQQQWPTAREGVRPDKDVVLAAKKWLADPEA